MSPQSPTALPSSAPGVGASFPVSGPVCALLFCLSLCVIWHPASPTALSVLFGEGMGSFHCAMRGPSTSKLPVSCREGPAGPWKTDATTEADLAVSSQRESSAVHQCVSV